MEYYHDVIGDLNDVFTVDLTNFEFTVPYTEDISKADLYIINYRVWYADYQDVFVAT